MTTEVTTDAVQTTVTLSPVDLEDMIRRVVREELSRLLTPPALPEPAVNGEEEAVLVEKGGVLVARAKLIGDVTDIVARVREEQIQTLLERIGV